VRLRDRLMKAAEEAAGTPAFPDAMDRALLAMAQDPLHRCGAWLTAEGPKSVCNADVIALVVDSQEVPAAIGCLVCAPHARQLAARDPHATFHVYPSGDCADPLLERRNREALYEALSTPERPFWQLQAESAAFAVLEPANNYPASLTWRGKEAKRAVKEAIGL
jgi:hypothetical protein